MKTSKTLKELHKEGFTLQLIIGDTKTHRHFRQHVYKTPCNEFYYVNDSRLDTVKSYPNDWDVREYIPTKD